MKSSKYLLKCADNASKKPINSIDTFASLDDEFIVAGSSDKNLRFIDNDTLEEIAKYGVDKKSVNCVCVSGIGINGEDPVIVTGGKDSVIQIWNPMSGTLERSIQLPTKEVKAIAMYRGSETYIVLGTKDSKVLVWDFERDELAVSFEGHKGSVYAVSITSSVDLSDIESGNDIEGICLASGSSDRTARTWSLSRKRKKKKFRHPWAVYTLVVSNTGPRPIMICAGADPSMKVWDAKSGVLLRTLDGHFHRVNHMALWEGFQMLLITASADHTIRVYDVVTGECVTLLVGHKDVVLRVAIAGSVPKIISSSDDMSLIQWDLNSIIEDHYYNDGDDIGLRKNEVEPHIPEYSYTLPLGPQVDPRATIVSPAVTRTDLESIIRAAEKEDEVQAAAAAVKTATAFPPASETSPATNCESLSDGRVAPSDGLEDGDVIVKASSSGMARRASLNLVHNIMGIMKGTNQVAAIPEEPPEENLKSKAKAAVSTFKVAQIEQELSAEKQRQDASEKLALRLKRKKRGATATTNDPEIQTQAPVEEEKSPLDELEALKAEKMRQHKRQEQRSRQSMSLAKGRAAEALARRLEMMAKKKEATNSSRVVEEEEEESDAS